jgi:hypothetical protein
MVATAFAPLLDGVSYVDPVIFPGPFENCIAATFQARQMTTNVALCQIYGMGIANLGMETSFIRESWVSANADVPWGTLPLVFDRRNPVREDALRGDLMQRAAGRKVVLVTCSGISSPFPYGKPLMEGLRMRLDPKEFMIVDLKDYRSARFFDFLGLFDIAHCLISVDTGFRHLAAASNLPVVSIINPSPSRWHGSAWRPSDSARFYYNEFPARIRDVAVAVLTARNRSTRPKLVHVFADWRDRLDPDTIRRQQVAVDSWQAENDFAPGYWENFEVIRDVALRDGRTVGDQMPVPFIKDLIEAGLRKTSKDSDIIVYSNADICFAPGLTGQILEACERKGAAFCQRWDFPRLSKPFISTGMIRKGRWYPGCDLFAVTVEWWKKHGAELPDLLIGREKVDQTFRQLIKYYHGAEIEAGIYHEKHPSFWERPENFHSNGGNLYNRKLAAEWAERIGVGDNDQIWWSEEVDRRTL